MTVFDLDALTSAIGPRDEDAADRTREHVDGLVKPLGALGRLEDLAIWLSGAQGQSPPRPLDRVRVVVFAGDHGVAGQGVSAYPSEVTAAMVATFLAGRAGVSVLAAQHDAGVRVLDLGVDADLDVPAEVTRFKVRRGSGAIDREDALSDDEPAARPRRRRDRRRRGGRRRRRPADRGRHGHRQHDRRRRARRRRPAGSRRSTSSAPAPASTTPRGPSRSACCATPCTARARTGPTASRCCAPSAAPTPPR
ncbi:hypothetical protein GCM10025868_42720 [Angustibacter aerolatus]|uniref:Nicotinate-nucleotide--dimethylbenzimidazole phosphoribosyltransferase n=1 Tax=Angustibacter aerolatus TaxID=1162965 RepID=A0ABQ6JL75_9ACTN|nr:hypothetical protein GCM10025868_42720 [Angustibacter aerolatus]